MRYLAMFLFAVAACGSGSTVSDLADLYAESMQECRDIHLDHDAAMAWAEPCAYAAALADPPGDPWSCWDESIWTDCGAKQYCLSHISDECRPDW